MWNDAFTELTRYLFEDVRFCYETLLTHYEETLRKYKQETHVEPISLPVINSSHDEKLVETKDYQSVRSKGPTINFNKLKLGDKNPFVLKKSKVGP